MNRNNVEHWKARMEADARRAAAAAEKQQHMHKEQAYCRTCGVQFAYAPILYREIPDYCETCINDPEKRGLYRYCGTCGQPIVDKPYNHQCGAHQLRDYWTRQN